MGGDKKFIINGLANYVGFLTNSVISFIAIPIYYKTLGESGWAVIAYCISIQGLLMLLDAGLGQVMPKEFSGDRDSSGNNKNKLNNFRCYYVVAAISSSLPVIFYINSHVGKEFLCNKFAEGLSTGTVFSIYVLYFIFTFSNSVNYAFLSGRQRQLTANTFIIVFSILRNVLALTLVYKFKNPLAYAISFAVVACLEYGICTFYVNKIAGCRFCQLLAFKLPDLQLFKLTPGIIIGIMIIQLERVTAGITMPSVEFGKYMIVGSLAMVGFQVSAAITKAFMPAISHEYSITNDWGGVYRKYVKLLIITSLVIFTSSQLLTGPVIRLWFRGATGVNDIIPAVQIIYIGICLNIIYGIFYIKYIIRNDGVLVAVINTIAFLVVALVLFWNSMLGAIDLTIGGQCLIALSVVQLSVVGIRRYLKHE